ncbi:MAG: hypothetical protein Q4E67_02855 [Planctomycetia bacterium]|nr:hypothetical protein [Planctomycetia bacterium]
MNRNGMRILFLLFFGSLMGWCASAVAQNQPLAPPGDSFSISTQDEKKAEQGTEKKQERPAVPGFRQLLFSIGVITALLIVLILILKKFRPCEAKPLSKEVFEILGKSPLAFHQQLYYLRCGNRLFIVSISQNGVDRIGEIEDLAEVERITRICHGEILGTRPISLPQVEKPTLSEKKKPEIPIMPASSMESLQGRTFEEIYKQVVAK